MTPTTSMREEIDAELVARVREGKIVAESWEVK